MPMEHANTITSQSRRLRWDLLFSSSMSKTYVNGSCKQLSIGRTLTHTIGTPSPASPKVAFEPSVGVY
jgi:hypothetical protein